ncbi:MAG TPA: hypothetical protein VLQ90_06985 [Pyrinomonadaceae bacterium]|nr:hypothetical protein [Pyrinomonadaceae bacterium]
MRRIFTTTVFVALLSVLSLSAFAQSESRDDMLKQIETKRAELATLEKKFLAPSDGDRTAYAEFVGPHDRGLIRLLPREVYDKDTTLTVRGGGAFYSFTRLTHVYGYGSDISLEQGFLQVGFAGADYGMLINVGDVPLEEMNAEHSSVRFLAAYNAVLEEPQARLEQRRFGDGTSIDGVPYSERVRAQVKTTYVVRSINYSESDVLVAFRVIRKDTDGSLIIAWKMLKEFPIPDLARNKTQQ